MEDCLFCMIAEGKIPSKKLYEDEQVVAFYDINPQHEERSWGKYTGNRRIAPQSCYIRILWTTRQSYSPRSPEKRQALLHKLQ